MSTSLRWAHRYSVSNISKSMSTILISRSPLQRVALWHGAGGAPRQAQVKFIWALCWRNAFLPINLQSLFCDLEGPGYKGRRSHMSHHLMSYDTSSYVICHIILCHMSHHLMSYVTSSYVSLTWSGLVTRGGEGREGKGRGGGGGGEVLTSNEQMSVGRHNTLSRRGGEWGGRRRRGRL